MIKQLILIVILLLKAMLLNSQVANNFTKNSFSLARSLFFPTINKEISILEINHKQRLGFPPTPGFVIYNNKSNRFEYFNGAAWYKFNPYRTNPPIISTAVATGITCTEATCGGTIKIEDDLVISGRGICWSTHTQPTIADSITSDGHGPGDFSSHLEGLMANTSYFVRAYATINKTTNYGNEISFKTPPYKLLCTYGVDSVTLKTENYHHQGGVEWQASTDTIHWTTIPGAVNDTYQFIPLTSQYYRAVIASQPTNLVWVNQTALLKYLSMPKNLTTGNIAGIEDFDSPGEWSITEGNGSLEADAIHCLEGKNSIKLSTGSGVSTTMQKDGPFNFSSLQVIRFWYYVPDIASVAGVTIQLTQSVDSRFINFQSSPYKLGWNSFEVPRSAFQNVNGADWNLPFDKLKITLRKKGTGISWVSIDRIEGITAATIPAVCINFDDGYESVFTQAFPIMKARNIRATSYLVTSYVGQEGMVTWDQCRIMDKEGWDMGCHTHTHPNLAILTEAEIDRELNTCRDILIAQGLTKAANFVAYPYGSNNELVQQRMAANNMTLGRGVISHYLMCPPNFKYTIESRNIASDTPLEEVKRAIDNAIAGGHVISLLFHNIVEKPVEAIDWSIADFQELMDYIVLKQIQPLTITQYNDLITRDTYVYKMSESK